MGPAKRNIVISFVVFLSCLPVFVAACGGDAADTELTGTAAERARKILGAKPSGAARDVVRRGYMVVANDKDYAPQSSVDETTGQLAGFDVDVAKAVGEILGLEVRFTNPEWESVPAGLNKRRFDVSIGSMPITPDYDRTVEFTKPYSYVPAQLLVREGGPQVEGVGDLAGKTVGVAVATTYHDFLKQESDATVRVYPTDAGAFAALRKGDLDFVLAAGQTGQQAIRDGQPFAFSGSPLYYADLGIAVAEGESDWVKLLDYAVAEMRADGSLSELSKKWYGGHDFSVAD